MPQRPKPIKQRARFEDESTGNPPGHRGPHQPGDEALAGKGSKKGGLNRQAGDGTLGTKQNDGILHGHSHKAGGLRHDKAPHIRAAGHRPRRPRRGRQ